MNEDEKSLSDHADDLENNRTDDSMTFVELTVGLIPGAGPILSTLIKNAIPNQRVDRVIKYLRELSSRLEYVEKAIDPDNKYFLDLFEDGITQAFRVLSDARNKYIAEIVSKSVDVGEINYESQKKLLTILGELTDRDIDILILIDRYGSDRACSEFTPKAVSIARYRDFTEEEKYNYDLEKNIWLANIGALERFNLVSSNRELEDLDRTGEYIDEVTGLPEILNYSVSNLGELLIKTIGVELSMEIMMRNPETPRVLG